MAQLNKVTTDTYTVGALQLNQLLELYLVDPSTLELSLVRTIEAVDLGGDFTNDFSVDFNGGKPTELYLEDEGMYILKIPNTGEEYIIYNYTSLIACQRQALEDLSCNKCDVNDLDTFNILLSAAFVFTGLDGYLNVNVAEYTATITLDQQLELWFKIISRLYLYCNGCDPNTTDQCNCQ